MEMKFQVSLSSSTNAETAHLSRILKVLILGKVFNSKELLLISILVQRDVSQEMIATPSSSTFRKKNAHLELAQCGKALIFITQMLDAF